MIPVGNRTRHNFSMWCFVEFYIRQIIMAVVLYRVSEVGISLGTLRLLGILFCMWSLRPIYYQFKTLYNSWKWAKHEEESDALKVGDKQ